MGVEVYVRPDDAWKFFEEHKERLIKEQIAIAENSETEHTVYMTEDKGCPLLSVWRGEYKLYEEPAVSNGDLKNTAQRIYIKYLLPVVVAESNKPKFITPPPDEEEDGPDPELEALAMQDEIYRREDTLQLVTEDYLTELFCCKDYQAAVKEYGDIAAELLDRVCEILASEFLISIYRPKWVYHDDTGCEEFVEFPYDYLAFGEEDEEEAIETAQ